MRRIAVGAPENPRLWVGESVERIGEVFWNIDWFCDAIGLDNRIEAYISAKKFDNNQHKTIK